MAHFRQRYGGRPLRQRINPTIRNLVKSLTHENSPHGRSITRLRRYDSAKSVGQRGRDSKITSIRTVARHDEATSTEPGRNNPDTVHAAGWSRPSLRNRRTGNESWRFRTALSFTNHLDGLREACSYRNLVEIVNSSLRPSIKRDRAICCRPSESGDGVLRRCPLSRP